MFFESPSELTVKLDITKLNGNPTMSTSEIITLHDTFTKLTFLKDRFSGPIIEYRLAHIGLIVISAQAAVDMSL